MILQVARRRAGNFVNGKRCGWDFYGSPFATGPLFGWTPPPDFKILGIKGRAAAEVSAAVSKASEHLFGGDAVASMHEPALVVELHNLLKGTAVPIDGQRRGHFHLGTCAVLQEPNA